MSGRLGLVRGPQDVEETQVCGVVVGVELQFASVGNELCVGTDQVSYV